MDTMSLDLQKIQLAQFILGLNDASLIDKINQVIGANNPVKREPCHYTIEEVQDRLRVCESEAIAGYGLAHDDIEKESLNWI